MIATAFLLLLGLLALSVPVGAVLGVMGLALGEIYAQLPLWLAAGQVSWNANSSFTLFALPLFVLLGQILLRAGIAERMYAALAHWMSWIPGGLMHSNIAACTLFSATCGSSSATAATVGSVAMSQAGKYRYNEGLFCGSIASGGTLGILIPPSINLILYGVLTDTSIPKLYLAGMLPGLLLSGLFMAAILVLCLFRPRWGGLRVESSWKERIASLPDLLPPIFIFFVVVGSIYSGLATPTESAALAVMCAFGMVAFKRRLTLTMLRQILESTVRITALLQVLVMAAYFLNYVFSFIGLTGQLNSMVTSLGLTPHETLLVIIVFYLVLGMFMETLAMMIATVPIITPVVLALGFDPVWFGILVMLLIETAMITPPVGSNLFVIQGVRGGGHVHEVMFGSAPFVVALLVMVGLIVLWPDIVLWLPDNFFTSMS